MFIEISLITKYFLYGSSHNLKQERNFVVEISHNTSPPAPKKKKSPAVGLGEVEYTYRCFFKQYFQDSVLSSEDTNCILLRSEKNPYYS